LNYDFIDLDKLFEESYKIGISSFFVKYGEEMFRRIERELLIKNLAHQNTVLSCGGGTPCYRDNMDLMNKTGLTVYLSLTPAALASRLENSRKERPLLHSLPGKDLLEKIFRHLPQREAFYLKAQLVVDGISINPEETAATILQIQQRQNV
jgi:shikimate kinase